MVYLCKLKKHGSLYSRCKYSVVIHAWYVHKWLFNSGLCAARSALSSIVTIKGYKKLSEHPFISRYLKSIYNRHPSLPKYTNIWDISLGLDYYNIIQTNDKLQFKGLAKKTYAFHDSWST